MRHIHARARELLDLVSADAPAPASMDPARIDTAWVIHRLAEVWPEPLDERRRRDLEALCREIAVKKRVLKSYDAGWGAAPAADPLPPSWWPVLIAVLLAYGAPGEGMDEASFGLALKSLNSALRALDMAEGIDGVARLPELRSWSGDILEGLDGRLDA